MSAQWFCKIAGTEHGPLTGQQLLELTRANKVKSSDLVRKDNSPWITAAKVKGLFPLPQEDGSSDTANTAPETTQVWAKTAGATKSQEPSGDSIALSASSSGGEKPPLAGATRSPRELGPGSRLGNYQIMATLGEGGMGVVLKAQHVRMERIVALKVLRSQAVQSPVVVSRFQKEVRAAAKLVHSNIVTAYDADEVDGVHFLVMEYVNGFSLAEVLAKSRKLEIDDVLNYVIQTARGLEYAHSEGVVHRDIKPGNLLLDKRGTVKILDMGLASIKETQEEAPQERGGEFVTQENQLLGTFDYMPPEQAEDAHSVDHRADIYSLGCTLYRLLTGRLPYSGETAIKKILAHRDNPIPSIRTLRSDVPAAVDQVFGRMLAKKPAARYQSMTEVIDDLEACRAGKSRLPNEVASSDSAIYHARVDHLSPSQMLRANDNAIYIPVPTDDDDDGDSSFAMIAPVNGNRFYWQVMGQSTGPFTREQLRAKKVQPDDLVRDEYSSDWTRADEIKDLF
jgi:serine/threonine protein kinase